MIIPSRFEYLKAVDKTDCDKDIKEKLFKLYEHILGNENVENVECVIDEVIKKLFPAVYTVDNMLPYNFIFSPIGKVLLTILFNNEKFLTMNDIIELSKNVTPDKKGFTRQYLNQEIHGGNLKAEKSGGRWIFRETEVFSYFENKKNKFRK